MALLDALEEAGPDGYAGGTGERSQTLIRWEAPGGLELIGIMLQLDSVVVGIVRL